MIEENIIAERGFCMSTFSLVDILIIITICFEFVYILLVYFLVRSDINILKNAKNIDELDKWALKYVKKYNFNKDIILANIIKAAESGTKTKKMGRSLFLIETIFVILYFISRVSEIVRFGILNGRSVTVLDKLMIFIGISAVWAVYLFNFIHQRNIVAYEQFIRLFKKEENNSSN